MSHDFIKVWSELVSGAVGTGALTYGGPRLLLQTTLGLSVGLAALRVLRRRGLGTRDALCRALLLSTLVGGTLSMGLSGYKAEALPALWKVSLPALGFENARTPSDSATPRADLTSPAAAVEPGVGIAAERELEPARGLPGQSGLEVPSVLGASAESALVEKATSQALAARSSAPKNNRYRGLIGGLGLLWFGGSAVWLMWLGACHKALRRLRLAAAPVREAAVCVALTRACAEVGVPVPALLSHAAVRSPFLCGLWRPAIVLPVAGGSPDAPALDGPALRAVFLHEATHLKRRDLWWNVLGRVGCALLWPQPLLWRLCRHLEQSSEEACDRAVLDAGCERGHYARCLLDWAQERGPRRAPRLMAVGIAGIGVTTGRSATGHSSLSRRVQSILDPSNRGGAQVSERARWAIGIAALVGTLSTPLLIGIRASPQTSLNETPRRAHRIIGDWAITVGGASAGRLQNVKLERHLGGKTVFELEGQSARFSMHAPRFWVLTNARIRTWGSRGLASDKRLDEVWPDVPATVSNYLSARLEDAQLRSKPAVAALEQDKSGDHYRVSIGGVLNGVLQSVTIQQRLGGGTSEIFFARTMRRRMSGSAWELADFDSYNFSDASGLISDASGQRLIIAPGALSPALSTFLQQQTRAANQGISAMWPRLQPRQKRRDMKRAVAELGRLQEWAKTQGTAAIAGHVKGEAGEPMAGIPVVASIPLQQLERILGVKPGDYPQVYEVALAFPTAVRQLLEKSVTTRSDGTFHLTGLAATSYNVTVGSNGPFQHVPAGASPPPQVLLDRRRVVTRARRTTVSPALEMTRGGLLNLRVLDRATGAALPGVSLVVGGKSFRPVNGVSTSTRPSYVAITDAQGQARLRLPVGTSRFTLAGQVVPEGALAALSNGVLYNLSERDEGDISFDGGPFKRYHAWKSLDFDIARGQIRKIVVRLNRYVAPPTPRHLQPGGSS